jgi:hypothetical protein
MQYHSQNMCRPATYTRSTTAALGSSVKTPICPPSVRILDPNVEQTQTRSAQRLGCHVAESDIPARPHNALRRPSPNFPRAEAEHSSAPAYNRKL